MIRESSQRFDNPVATAIWTACIGELNALKPGNVSIYADGHGMAIDDFVASARCIAAVLGRPDLAVGQRIFLSIEATHRAVGCNTNLGIVLLCAPLAHSALQAGSSNLRTRLREVLARLDRRDTEQVFRAIRLANPAGLGNSENHDVEQPATAGLLEVMHAAEQRDRIAYQYSHDFADIFELGLPALEKQLARGLGEPPATTGVYLNFLARLADTHIRRKLGEEKAEEVRIEGARLLRLFEASRRVEQMEHRLLAFDNDLKQRGINPGTSADLTVATLLAKRLQMLLEHDFPRLLPGRGAGIRQEAGCRSERSVPANPTKPN